MSGIKIVALPPVGASALTDVFAASQSAVTYKETLQQVLTLFQSNGTALSRVNDTNVTLTLGGSPLTSLLNATSITAGWTGQLSSSRGGTGINNGSSTLTLGGNLTTSGAFASTFTMSNTTTVTFPTSGTLATTSQIPTGAALTKADDTNVTLTLGGSSTTALVNAASITAGWTGQLGLTRGGTAASLTASNGGIVYSNASTLAVLAGTATAGQMLQSGASTTPAWSTSTYPATNGISTLLYASSANVMAALPTANSSVLVTSSGGVPSLSTTLPSGLAATNMTLTTPTLGAATATTITFNPTTGGVVGTTTNNNTNAGNVGEFVSSVVPIGTPVSLTTNTPIDITSIPLTAGDWDAWGNVGFTGNALTTFAIGRGWISQTSATSPDASLYAQQLYPTSPTIFTLGFPTFAVPGIRVPIGSTTTIYLSVVGSFGVNTCSGFGGIYARRRR